VPFSVRSIKSSSSSSRCAVRSDRKQRGRLEIARLGTSRLGTSRLGTGRPGTGRLETDHLETGRPGTGRLETDHPGTSRPGIGRLETDRLGTNHPGTGRLETDRLEIGRPGIGRLETDHLGTGRRGIGRLETDHLETGRLGTDRPGTDRPGINRPEIDRPGINRPEVSRLEARRIITGITILKTSAKAPLRDRHDVTTAFASYHHADAGKAGPATGDHWRSVTTARACPARESINEEKISHRAFRLPISWKTATPDARMILHRIIRLASKGGAVCVNERFLHGTLVLSVVDSLLHSLLQLYYIEIAR